MNLIDLYIGEQIKEMRESKNFTQEELARKIHISRTTLSNIESGKHGTVLIKLYDIARILETEIIKFLPDDNWVQNNKNKKIIKKVTFEIIEE